MNRRPGQGNGVAGAGSGRKNCEIPGWKSSANGFGVGLHRRELVGSDLQIATDHPHRGGPPGPAPERFRPGTTAPRPRRAGR